MTQGLRPVGLGASLLVLLFATSAAAQPRTVSAEWDANTDGATTGYVLSYGTEPGVYRWTQDAGNATSVRVTLESGAAYYFSVSAYDARGTRGAGSAEATIDLRAGAPTGEFSAVLQGSDTAFVQWSLRNVESATINGQAVEPSGTATVIIRGPTTFTLEARSPQGQTLTRAVTVTPVTTAAPTARISATWLSTGKARVSWSTTNAERAAINGVPVSTDGSAVVPVSDTMTFHLVATSANGAKADASSTLQVEQAGLSAHITAAPEGAGKARVTWSSTGATRAWINGVPVALSGTVLVPHAGAAKYRLLIEGDRGAMLDAYAYVEPMASGAAPTARPF